MIVQPDGGFIGKSVLDTSELCSCKNEILNCFTTQRTTIQTFKLKSSDLPNI